MRRKFLLPNKAYTGRSSPSPRFTDRCGLGESAQSKLTFTYVKIRIFSWGQTGWKVDLDGDEPNLGSTHKLWVK